MKDQYNTSMQYSLIHIQVYLFQGLEILEKQITPNLQNINVGWLKIKCNFIVQILGRLMKVSWNYFPFSSTKQKEWESNPSYPNIFQISSKVFTY